MAKCLNFIGLWLEPIMCSLKPDYMKEQTVITVPRLFHCREDSSQTFIRRDLSYFGYFPSLQVNLCHFLIS